MTKGILTITATIVFCVFLGGCLTGPAKTTTEWQIRESSVEAMGNRAALAVFQRVFHRDGIVSDKEIRLVGIGRRLNDLAADLASGDPNDETIYRGIDDVFHRELQSFDVEDAVMVEAVTLLDELLTESSGNREARLWLALFLDSFSHRLLEEFENGNGY